MNKTLDKKALSALIDACYRKHRNKATVLLADRLRSLGFDYATRAGVSICMDHMVIPQAKGVLLGEAQGEVQRSSTSTKKGSSPTVSGTTRSSTSGPALPTR